MNTTERGNKLEDQIYDYLSDQVRDGDLVYGIYPSSLCKVRKKKKYFCKDRNADVEFDVVVEVRREECAEPHLYVVFECKNHIKPIEDSYVRNFSDQIRTVFGHAGKGIFVTSSRLQSGAESLAKSRRLGIVKFDENGIDIIADRTVGTWAENRFIQTQISDSNRRSKSLMFSAYFDGRYFSSFDQILQYFEAETTETDSTFIAPKEKFIAFLPKAEIHEAAVKARSMIDYTDGEVDVEKICAVLNLKLSYSEQTPQDADGNIILGSANFAQKSIEINQHGNRNRERFTIAHEIGHFCLEHGKYLRSDFIVEQDLFIDTTEDDDFNYKRLEYQANLFASMLLLPETQFRIAVDNLRDTLKTHGRNFGYIYVDDQPCNLVPYNTMLDELSCHFGVSKQAIEITLKRAKLVTDDRKVQPLRHFQYTIG